MGTALNILKLVGLVLTGAFAVLGLLTEFRNNHTKKITTWGKIALIGILTSTALSFVSQVLESAKSAREAQESAKQAQEQIARSNEILNNLNRSLNPLANVRVTYWLTAPLEAPEFAAYRERLIKGVAEILASGDQKSIAGTGFISRRGPGGPEAVSIPSNSPLMPQRDELIPFYLLRYSGLQFSSFRKHHSDSEFVADDVKTRPEPDLWFEVGTETGAKNDQVYDLEYDLQSHQLTIFASDLFSDPKYWRSNNQIQAVPDLSNAQLALQIDNTVMPMLPVDGRLDAVGQTLSHLRSQMHLGSVILKINTRELWIKGRKRDMTRLVNSGPRPFAVYTTIFPKNVDDLQLK